MKYFNNIFQNTVKNYSFCNKSRRTEYVLFLYRRMFGQSGRWIYVRLIRRVVVVSVFRLLFRVRVLLERGEQHIRIYEKLEKHGLCHDLDGNGLENMKSCSCIPHTICRTTHIRSFQNIKKQADREYCYKRTVKISMACG